MCQNQTIADSNAPLALDLRQQTRAMIAAGKTDDEIRAYMVERYGDFVLYKPPFKATTAVLWVGPGLLIVIGFTVMFVMLRRRRDAADASPPPDATRRREIEALLVRDEGPGPNKGVPREPHSMTGWSGSSFAFAPAAGKCFSSSTEIAVTPATAPSWKRPARNASCISAQAACHSACATFAAMPRSATISTRWSASRT